MLRDFPTPYDPKYWSDDGKKFNVADFNKDLYMRVHEFYAQLEKAKKEYPTCFSEVTNNCSGCDNHGVCEYEPAMNWYFKWIGAKGTGNGVLKLSR